MPLWKVFVEVVASHEPLESKSSRDENGASRKLRLKLPATYKLIVKLGQSAYRCWEIAIAQAIGTGRIVRVTA
jgi:hypothetical protein